MSFARGRKDGVEGVYAGNGTLWYKFADVDTAIMSNLRFVINIDRNEEVKILRIQ